MLKPFFLVLARDEKNVSQKINELEAMNVPFLIVCGKKLSHPSVVYRPPRGKYDALNFGISKIPHNYETIILNDVDTKIANFKAGLDRFEKGNLDLMFAGVEVKAGPQKIFYPLLDFIRRKIPITASGELMIIKKSTLLKLLPIKPCKAEDSYLLFKTMELGQKVAFCDECYVETERTNTPNKEVDYKRRTVCGIYQALEYAKPSLSIRVFYTFLPMVTPFLLVFGDKGYYWMRGINLGFKDYLHGDRAGSWKPINSQCEQMTSFEDSTSKS